MNICKLISGAVLSVVMLFSASPAKAGIPVIDAANLANSIQQVLAWAQQAQDMINQLNQLRQQYEQLQTMTTKLEGIRNLGSILNDPAIRDQLPPEMRDSTHLLLNPAALVTSEQNINQMLASFGVNRSMSPTAGVASADTLGRVQQILASTQTRNTQLTQLASRVDTTVDAKDSLDMVNRNVLEAANVSNQMSQTMAALEAARQAADLKRLAENQTYFSNVKDGGAQPIRSLTY